MSAPTDPRGDRGVFCSLDCLVEWGTRACNLGVPEWKEPGDSAG